jgi:hypothetical protein
MNDGQSSPGTNAQETMGGAATSPRAAATSARVWNLDPAGRLGRLAWRPLPDRPVPRAAEARSIGLAGLCLVPYLTPARARHRQAGHGKSGLLVTT